MMRKACVATLAVAGMVLSGCSAQTGQQEGLAVHHVTFDRTVPNPRGLPVGDLLDQALSVKGMRGVMLGTVVGPGSGHVVEETPGGDASGIDVATYYPFRVLRSVGYGPDHTSLAGQILQLRVPGGQVANTKLEVDGGPEVAVGQTLLVFDQEQALLVDETPKSVITVINQGNIGVVTGKTVTFTMGQTTLSDALHRLTRHPARS